MIKQKEVIEELDIEWMKLIIEALEMGMTKEEIREFLNHQQGHMLGQKH